MKKYILFAWWSYEASGGMKDIKGSYDTRSELYDILDTMEYDYYTVVDRDTWEIL